jgi:hypothetical protein
VGEKNGHPQVKHCKYEVTLTPKQKMQSGAGTGKGNTGTKMHCVGRDVQDAHANTLILKVYTRENLLLPVSLA